jgi:NADH dehydrogenase
MFPLVGFGSQRRLRPVAVEDVARVLVASVHEQRLNDVTVPVLGPDELTLTSAVQRVAVAIGCRPAYIPAPVALHRALAWVLERVMTVPLVSAAQVRILVEGIVEPALAPQLLPADLVPTTPYSEESIRAGLPADERFSCADLRMFHRAA